MVSAFTQSLGVVLDKAMTPKNERLSDITSKEFLKLTIEGLKQAIPFQTIRSIHQDMQEPYNEADIKIITYSAGIVVESAKIYWYAAKIYQAIEHII